MAGFGAVFPKLPPNTAKANTICAFLDGDFVFTKTEYNFFVPKIGFDIFGFENGKIVEHWDNYQLTPSVANSCGHTINDSITEIKDLDKTEAIKGLVKHFVEANLFFR